MITVIEEIHPPSLQCCRYIVHLKSRHLKGRDVYVISIASFVDEMWVSCKNNQRTLYTQCMQPLIVYLQLPADYYGWMSSNIRRGERFATRQTRRGFECSLEMFFVASRITLSRIACADRPSFDCSSKIIDRKQQSRRHLVPIFLFIQSFCIGEGSFDSVCFLFHIEFIIRFRTHISITTHP